MSDLIKYNEEQIKLLQQLQHVDEQLMVIERTRRDIPTIICNCENIIAELEERLVTVTKRIQEHKQAILVQQGFQKTSEGKIGTYEKLLKEAKNDKEYELIEEDLQEAQIDIELAKKNKKRFGQTILVEEGKQAELTQEMNKQKHILEDKQKTLQSINVTNEKKEMDLKLRRNKILKYLDVTTYSTYEYLHRYKKNIVANVVNEACNRCFIMVPIQTQLEIRERKKIACCENCSRIFANIVEVIEPGKTKPKRRVRKSISSSK